MLRELEDEDGGCRMEDEGWRRWRMRMADGEDVWEEGRGKGVGVGREREWGIERKGAGMREKE